jgi:transcriptional regulator with XRE-family HTH domain
VAETVQQGDNDSDKTIELITEVAKTMDARIEEGDAGVTPETEATPKDEPEGSQHIYSQRVIGAIRASRKDQGMSARQLAELCEALSEEVGLTHTLSRGRLAKLENGLTTGSMTVDELIVASRALGVSVGVLLGDAIMQSDEQEAAEQLRQLHAHLGSVLSEFPGKWISPEQT